MKNSSFVFILRGDFQGFPISGSPFLYCSDINQLASLIQRNKHRRIILVGKAEHIQEVYNINIERSIHEMFILNDGTKLNIKNKEVTMINTNEQDLMFNMLYAAFLYTHREEMVERKLQNNGLAAGLKMDAVNLLKQIEIFL